MPSVGAAYLNVMPRLAPGSNSAVTRMGRQAGETATRAFNRELAAGARQAERAGAASGTRFARGFTRDASNSMRGARTELGRVGEQSGREYARRFSDTAQRQLRGERANFSREGGRSGREYGKQFAHHSQQQLQNERGRFHREGQSLGRSMTLGFGTVVKGFVATYLGAQLVRGIGSSIQAASDLNETVTKSRNVFKNSSREVEAWGATAAEKLGLSKNAAIGAAAQFGDMFLQLGLTGKEATKTSMDVVKLAADLGSFHNLSTDEVLDRIAAGMRGEYDSLQQLIPAITDARVKQEALTATGKANADQLTEGEKAMAALAIITKDSANATNDFAETSDSLANQQKTLASKVEDTKAALGEALMPALTETVTFLNEKAIPAFQSFMNGMFGKPNVDTNAMDNIVRKGEDMGLLANQSAGEFSGWYAAGQDLATAFKGIASAMTEIVNAYSKNPDAFNALAGILIAATGLVKATNAVTAFGGALGALGKFMLSPAGLAIAAIAGLFYSIYVTVKNVQESGVIQGLKKTFVDALSAMGGMALPFRLAIEAGFSAIQRAVDFFKEHWGAAWGAIRLSLSVVGGFFSRLGMTVARVFTNIRHALTIIFVGALNFVVTQARGVIDGVIRVFNNAKNAIVGAFNTVKNFLFSAWNFVLANVVTPIINFFKVTVPNAFNTMRHKIVVFFTAAYVFLAGIWSTIRNAVVTPIINFFSVTIPGAFNTMRAGVVNAFNTVKTFLLGAWNWIHSKVISPIIRFIGTTIPDTFDRMKKRVVDVWNNLKSAIAGVWDKILATGKEKINAIGKFINKIIDAVNKIPFIGIPRLPDPLIKKAEGGEIEGKASGGHVGGGPVGTDTVPARTKSGKPFLLDNGEHVLTRKDVQRMGGQDAVYAFRRSLAGRHPERKKDGGHIRDGKYRPGMGNLGMTDALVKLYRKFGGKGNYTSGYRPNGQDWHGSGLAADFGGFNQDGVAYKFQQKGEGLLELIHATDKSKYGVSRGRNHNFGEPLWGQHRNHLHVASTPEAISTLLSGDPYTYGPATGGGLDPISWLMSGAAKVAKKLLNAAIEKLKGALPQGKGVAPSAIRGIATGIPEKALAFFEDQGSQATMPFTGSSGRRGSSDVMREAFRVARAMGASNKVLLALFEAGFVESNFQNLTKAVDHDSLGYLQQRPSMGWPDPTNVATATRSFVSRAMRKEKNYWLAGNLAQAVQVSAFPSRYHEARGRAINALKGIWPGYVAGNYSQGGAVYDQGGWLPPGGIGMNQGTKPEAVLTPEESAGLKNIGAGELLDKLDRLIDAVERVAPGVTQGIQGGVRSARLAERRY